MTSNPFIDQILETLAFLKADAMSNREAKRGCKWLNEMIIKIAETLLHAKNCENFYYGKERIEPINLMAHELQKKGGILRLWFGARDYAEKMPLPGEGELKPLEYALMAFEELFRDLCLEPLGLDLVPDATEILLALKDGTEGDTVAVREELKRGIETYLYTLAEATYRLSLEEYRIWHEHREWEISGYGDDPSGPFDVHGVFDNLYLALNKFDTSHATIFGHLQTAKLGLDDLRADLPIMFVRGEKESQLAYLFAPAVKAVLTTPMRIFFFNPVEAVRGGEPTCSCEVSEFLSQERIAFLNRLNLLLQDRARAATETSVRRKWYEAAAELLVEFNWGQPVFTSDQADRLIALMNAAQREAWIAQRMAAHGEPIKLTDFMPSENDKKEKGKKAKKSAEARKGLRGPSTLMMKTQLEALKRYVAKMKGQAFTISEKETKDFTYANRFWQQNREEYEKAAKAEGEKRGYSSYRTLAQAFCNS